MDIIDIILAKKLAGAASGGSSGGGGEGVDVEDYLASHIDETLTMRNGILGVNCADSVEENNTLPITAAAVYASVGNVEVLLKTI